MAVNSPLFEHKLNLAELDELKRRRESGGGAKSRIQSIAEKLGALQKGMVAERDARRSQLEQKLHNLDTLVTETRVGDEKRFKAYQDTMLKLDEGLAQEKLSRELLDERGQKELELLGRNLALEIATERADRENEAKGIAERLAGVEDDVGAERQARQDLERRQGTNTKKELERLAAIVEHERKGRMASEAKAEALAGEVASLQERVAQGERAREAMEQRVVELVDGLCSRFQAEILAERKEREQMEETMLKLMEDTCVRVESGLASAS